MSKIKMNGGLIGMFMVIAAGLGAVAQELTMQSQEKQLDEHEKRLAELEAIHKESQ